MRGNPFVRAASKRTRSRPGPTDDDDDDDPTMIDPTISDPDTVMDSSESDIIARAFASLPERWQAALWYVDMEDMTPAAAAVFLDISPNAVSALIRRARVGLRQSYRWNTERFP